MNFPYVMFITMPQLDIGFSAMYESLQGSITTRMGCGGIFNNRVTTHFVLIPSVKNNWKLVND